MDNLEKVALLSHGLRGNAEFLRVIHATWIYFIVGKKIPKGTYLAQLHQDTIYFVSALLRNISDAKKAFEFVSGLCDPHRSCHRSYQSALAQSLDLTTKPFHKKDLDNTIEICFHLTVFIDKSTEGREEIFPFPA